MCFSISSLAPQPILVLRSKPTYFLSAFLRVEGDVPAVIVCKLASDIGRALGVGKQLSDVLGRGGGGGGGGGGAGVTQ